MDYSIDTLDSIVKDTKFLEIANLHKIQQPNKLRSSLDHLLPFAQLSGGHPDTDAPFEQTIDDMGTNKACGSRNQHVTSVNCEKRGIPAVRIRTAEPCYP